jgi:hypothetical protein
MRILVIAVAWDSAFFRIMETGAPRNELVQEVRDTLAKELGAAISEGVLPAMRSVGFMPCEPEAPGAEMGAIDETFLMRVAVNIYREPYIELNRLSKTDHTIAPLGVDA